LRDGYGRSEAVLRSSGTQVGNDGYLTALVYELLDAHGDTMRLADGLDTAPCWAAHLDYLRDLQRVGREALAWRERAAL
jgi:hypothetical protein